jgi:radical SAM protein with 4Fe4S-binding SPASM domain
VGITERIDRITFLTDEYRSEAPPVPKSVKIELTARCDFKCFFCASHMRLREKRDISWGFYTRVVREMRDLGVEELGVFYLGESFLVPWLPEAIRYAKAECGYPYVFLTTNGRMAEPERVRACIEAGLDSLKFSYNFADAFQFHEVTGVRPQAFKKITANLQAARRIRDEAEAATGHRCGLYASSILYDGDQHARMAHAVDGILPYVDEHYWLPLYGQAGLTSGAKGTRPTAGNQGRVGALRKPLPCWSLFTEGHITFDGRLSACCFDHDGRFNMGDLNELTFMEAWHSEPFRRLRRANLAEEVARTVCEKCLAYEECEAKPQPLTLMRQTESAPM